jgi:putative transposase
MWEDTRHNGCVVADMARPRRTSPPGVVFHVVNRAAKKSRLFDDDADYAAIHEVLARGLDRFAVALFAYLIMPNHWHFVITARIDRELSRFMHWFETTHARRWQLAKDADGLGAVYQGRFKSIPIQTDAHFLCVCRYVERNALRAGLVERAEDWRWSSLWQRINRADRPMLSNWPTAMPSDWLTYVNTPQTTQEVEAVRLAMNAGRPFGDETWSQEVAKSLGRNSARPRGRPQRVLKK